jgi:hypothetical protein
MEALILGSRAYVYARELKHAQHAKVLTFEEARRSAVDNEHCPLMPYQ